MAKNGDHRQSECTAGTTRLVGHFVYAKDVYRPESRDQF
jgi:hypothetical protein